MINFSEKFIDLEKTVSNEMRKIRIECPLLVYYGITSDKLYRVSFVSSIYPFKLESTNEIRVTQGKESDGVYWTCFDLLDEAGKEVFFVFCESLIKSIENETDETAALSKIKDKFFAWRLLFKNKGKISYEKYQGLYGELYFLFKELSKKTSFDNAVLAWVGPDGFSKDFSVEKEWYEIKTIGTSSSSVKINSLAQLDSDLEGHLVTIIVEKMSKEFEGELCNVEKLYNAIFDKLSNPIIKDKFANKVLNYGYIDEESSPNNSFDVKKVEFYKVSEEFPRLTIKSIKSPAISNVTYEIYLNAIEDFKETK